MKRTISKTAMLGIIGCIAFTANTAAAQDKSGKSQQEVHEVQMNILKSRQAELRKRISAEEKLRNREVSGVTSETMARMNEIQDSICLDLRSQLVTVTLQIEELTPRKASDQQFIEHANTVVQQHKNDANGTTEGAGKKH